MGGSGLSSSSHFKGAIGFGSRENAVRTFFDPHRMVAQDRRRDYGEDRYRLLGVIDGRAYVIVTQCVGSLTRIISALQGQWEGGREL